ncbi:hypothetical protein GQ600_20145 [Phytophthora cactorum]|nr:hypothetical protein GQ600_20145 [Phytophthora cactorum]
MKPLGILLRDHRELGVPITPSLSIPPDFSLPAAFFADATALFSLGVRQLQQQLDLVEVYCTGSGALLNHSKSWITCPNDATDAPRHDAVRYLGIPLGNRGTSVGMATQLDKITDVPT